MIRLTPLPAISMPVPHLGLDAVADAGHADASLLHVLHKQVCILALQAALLEAPALMARLARTWTQNFCRQ